VVRSAKGREVALPTLWTLNKHPYPFAIFTLAVRYTPRLSLVLRPTFTQVLIHFVNVKVGCFKISKHPPVNEKILAELLEILLRFS
jgi:hypothetical protein